MTAVLVPLVVLLPLLGAALALILGRHRRAQMAVSITVLAGVAVIAAVLLVAVDAGEPTVVHIGGWDAPFGIVLVVDRLSAIMLLISAIVLLVVLVYAVGQGVADRHRETPVSIFHPSYLILSAGVFDAFIAGDLFNLYVGFEILLVGELRAAHARRHRRAHPRGRHVHHREPRVVAVLPQRDRAHLRRHRHRRTSRSSRCASPSCPTSVQLILHLLLLIAFGIKAAVFPLSFWLPDSYPTAPAPVTAVFAGLLTKVGVYAIIRTETVIFAENDLTVLLMVVGGLTMLIGILGALTQADIKRLLSFTLVSHIGYMIFGIAARHPARPRRHDLLRRAPHHGADDPVPHDRSHRAIRRGDLDQPARRAAEGVAAARGAVLHPRAEPRRHPAVLGLPRQGRALPRRRARRPPSPRPPGPAWLVWVVIAAGAITSLITLYALTRFWNMAFWRRRDELEGYESVLLGSVLEAPEGATVTATRTTPVLMVVATTTLVIVTVLLTVFAGPIFELADRAAANLGDPSVYVSLVFPGGVR